MVYFHQLINISHGLIVIERHHLAILRAIEKQGSLTAAAASLHLTQSALSHTIKKLETMAGTELWIKEGRRLRFTQAGEYLLAVANRLLPQLEHADDVIHRIAKGEQGSLRIGMECHPCYQWLLKIVEPYLADWPAVDVDVKQKFQFGGMAALFGHEIDVLVTPDPLLKPGVVFEPVFDYEQVLVVSESHKLATALYVKPEELIDETLLTYPVETDRLDIFSHFLMPDNCTPRRVKQLEATDIMLQMVAANRGVAALPRWLVLEYANRLPIVPVRLGKQGIAKQIYIGLREGDDKIDYVRAFMQLARQ